jgi:predicted dehydrogenase
MSMREARACVDACDKAGITLSVNQNMRYDQSIRAMKSLLKTGSLGDIVLGSIEMRAIPHWMPWSQKLHSLSTFVMSIHHLDTFRYWFGTPDRVLASTRPDPRTKFPHSDGINLYILEYDSGIRATSWDDVWAGPAREGAEPDIGIRWRVEGTKGMARGTIGWPSYPAPTPSTLDYTVVGEPEWQQPRWHEVWFPDAFIGTMAQLLVALEEKSPPEISGRDNLQTIAMCEAVYAAAKEHRVTTVSEFL